MGESLGCSFPKLVSRLEWLCRKDAAKAVHVCELGASCSETPQCAGARGTGHPLCQLARQPHRQHPSTVMEAHLCLLRPPTRAILEEEKIKEDKNSLKVKKTLKRKKKVKN